MVTAIQQSSRQPDCSMLHRDFPVDVQDRFAREAATAMGFDFNRGRLDVTAHPFCCTLGPNDCRITTRYHGDFFNAAFFGVLHEAGHGLYEQGLPVEKLRPAHRRGRFAGHPRVAIAVVGEPGRPQPGLLGPLLSPGETALPRRVGRRPAGRFLLRHLRGAAVADPHRGRRGHLQPAHPDPLRVGAGAVGRPVAGGRPARRLEREIPAHIWALLRRTTARACCKTSTGAPD